MTISLCIMQRFEHLVGICNHILLTGNSDDSEFVLPEMFSEEWIKLLSMASLHGMLPVVMSFFETRRIEHQELRTIVIKWFGMAQMSINNYRMRLKTMCELAGMFAEAGLDVMFFKGAALAQLYPVPEWRVFSDIDFYLYGKWKEGNYVLARHGIESSPYPHHNTEAVLHNILLENHYDFVERLNHRQNLILDDELKRLADEEGRNIKATFLGENMKSVYVMTPTMNAIFLMRHMSAHFVSESIPLRMLYDWILFLRTHAKDVDWERVDKLYMASGMTEFVGIVQGLLQKYFQVEIPLCPVKPLLSKKTEKVWKSIACPPKVNPYKKKGWLYYLYEAKVFLANRWKHQIVYPGESYVFLFVRYSWSAMKRKLKTN